MTPMRVVLADDHALIRAGMSKLLVLIPGVEVIGEAADGAALLQLISNLQVVDLAVMDISMPNLSGIETMRRLRKLRPEIRVLIVSMHQNEEYVQQALSLGASGYMTKDAAPEELAHAINAIRNKEIYLSPSTSKLVLSEYVQRLRGSKSPLMKLTPRQLEVLKLVAMGYSTKEVALHLNRSVKTIETHRSKLMQLLEIHDTAGLVRYAVRAGLISVDH